ncbi:hypothetical protein ABBQ38_010400 [Trebouxia sp. C0009 RCD-2024]
MTQQAAADTVAMTQQAAADKVAEAEREAAARAAEAEKAAAAKVTEIAKQAADKVAQAEREAAGKVTEIGKEAADRLAQAGREAAARVAKAEREVAEQVAQVEREAADKAARAEQEAARQLVAVKEEAAQKARQEAEDKANRVKEELQRKMEGVKLRLEQQEATEKRLRSRLNKQDDKSNKVKEALVAAQHRNNELESLLDEAQRKIGCAAKHRKSAQQQLDAQEQDFEKLGQRLKAVSESPAASLPTISPRRTSRRDVDLGLSPAAPEGSPSPNSLPYQASPDHPAPMEEDGMMGDAEEDEEGELSSGADTPEAQTAQPARGISSWMARSVGRLIPFSTSKGPKPESAMKQHSGTSQHASPALPGHDSKGKKAGAHIHETDALPRGTPSGPPGPAAGSKRKAVELQPDEQLEEALQKSLLEYQEVVHRPATAEDGPPMKMHSPTRKRHRLAQSSSPAPGTPAAVAAAGDLAAEAVLQAAAAAKTPAEAAAAAEKVAEVVKGAAAEAVGGRASPPAGLNSENGDGAEVHMQQDESPAGASEGHLLQPAASTAHPATDPPHAAPSEPAAATSPLEAATAVALPNDASTVVLTARKRGRPSKAEQALRRQVPDAQTATATAVEAAGPSTAAIASTTDATKPTAAKGGGKASKSGNPGAKAASSKAAGAKGRKQLTAAAAAHKADKEPAKAEPKRVLSKTQADTNGKKAAPVSKKQASTSTTTAKSAGVKKPNTAKASSAVSSGTARRTSGRLASKSSAGGSQAAGPARSTRSKSHTTASGLAALEDTASKQPQPMTPIAEGDEEAGED